MEYIKCRHCKEKIEHKNEEYFFFCSKKCKTILEKTELEKRKKENKMHNPPARRGEIDKTNELVKQIIIRKDDVDLNPSGKPKGNRKCGKCGEKGHNTRTCKKGD